MTGIDETANLAPEPVAQSPVEQSPVGPNPIEPSPVAQSPAAAKLATPGHKVLIQNLKFYYGDSLALKSISLPLYAHKVTAFIGPSGCGKSTLLRVLNRMYDLYPNQRAEGEVILDGVNILRPEQDLNLLRARVGMVFQKPTPFPMSIHDNVAFGIKLYQKLPKAELSDRVEARFETSRSLGRGEGQIERFGPIPFGRSAAAPLHRAHRGSPAGSYSP